jgi:hypothetical protein
MEPKRHFWGSPEKCTWGGRPVKDLATGREFFDREPAQIPHTSPRDGHASVHRRTAGRSCKYLIDSNSAPVPPAPVYVFTLTIPIRPSISRSRVIVTTLPEFHGHTSWELCRLTGYEIPLSCGLFRRKTPADD